ncbi:MAG: 6-phosphogluconolactonase, partial [bacterium]
MLLKKIHQKSFGTALKVLKKYLLTPLIYIETSFEIFSTPLELAGGIAVEFKKTCEEVILVNGKINVALSGGSTPEKMFTLLAAEYKNKIDWSKVYFYWVDERCVPRGNEQSNFEMTDRILLKNIPVPEENVHRIIGEDDPEEEARRYSGLLKKNIPLKNNFPEFNLILLGTGEDGHTASIFPNQMELLNSEKLCALSIHPESNQKRITLTGKVINNAERICFLATGKGKAEVIGNILNKKKEYLKYPAAHILPRNGVLKCY